MVNTASIPLIFMGGWGGAHADSRQPQLLVPMGFLQDHRIYELEADAFGLNLAAKAGYPPAAFRRYIERTQGLDSKMSPLPAREVRLARIDEVLRSLPAVPFMPTGDFEKVQASARVVVPKPEPRMPPTLRRR